MKSGKVIKSEVGLDRRIMYTARNATDVTIAMMLLLMMKAVMSHCISFSILQNRSRWAIFALATMVTTVKI